MWTHSLQTLEYAHKFSLIKLSSTCKVVDINNVCVWDHFLSSSPTVWFCFLWKPPLAGLKPEHFRLLSADGSDGSAREHVVIIPHAMHTWPWRHMTGQRACVLPGGVQKWKYQIACYQIANIYLENKTLCRQLLISSVIIGNGTDQWLKCQVKMAFVLCCMKISNTHCVWEREVSVSECAKWLQVQITCHNSSVPKPSKLFCCLLLSNASLQLTLNFIKDWFGIVPVLTAWNTNQGMAQTCNWF